MAKAEKTVHGVDAESEDLPVEKCICFFGLKKDMSPCATRARWPHRALWRVRPKKLVAVAQPARNLLQEERLFGVEILPAAAGQLRVIAREFVPPVDIELPVRPHTERRAEFLAKPEHLENVVRF